jgi:hypothetical protein
MPDFRPDCHGFFRVGNNGGPRRVIRTEQAAAVPSNGL